VFLGHQGAAAEPRSGGAGSSGSTSEKASSRRARMDNKSKNAKRQMEEAMLKLMVSDISL